MKMNKKLYVMLMENKRPLNNEVIKRHVNHLKEIDDKGLLYLCGPFDNYAGGMVILKANSYEEAFEIAKKDPFVFEGFKTFEIRILEVADKNNNYGI